MSKNNPSQNFSMEQAMAFASSPAGKQLIAMLQQKGSSDLGKAQAYAASGNMEQAKDALSGLLADPQIRQFLKQMGG